MSYTSFHNMRQEDVAGRFRELDCGNTFEFSREGLSDWDIKQGATHTVAVLDGNTRAARVLKTVVHIIVDEDENGAVWEKWRVKTTFYRR